MNILNKFIQCCLPNTIIVFMASLLMFISENTIHTDPIILVGLYIVYLELSKLVYIVATGASVPIMLRYLMASLVAGMTVKFYISAIEKDAEWMLYYGAAAMFFLLLRWIAIHSTERGEKK